MKVRGIIDGKIYWWRDESWISNADDADELCRVDAERRLRILHANNRFLDSEDQVEVEIVESN